MKRRRVGGGGFTLVEAVLSMLVAGVLLTSATAGLASAGRARAAREDRATARFLADDLAAEIAERAYEEPGTTSPTMGVDSGETLAQRSTLDDVDDYRGLGESPPRTIDGAVMPQFAGGPWSRSVAVEYTTLMSPGAVLSATDAGIKRVTITVTRGSRVIETRVLLRGRGL